MNKPWVLFLLILFSFKGISHAQTTVMDTSAQKYVKGTQDPWLGVDKAQHFLASLIVTVGCGKGFQQRYHWPQPKARIHAVGITLMLGLGKETYDHFRPGHFFSWKDLVADFLGAGAGWFILNLK